MYCLSQLLHKFRNIYHFCKRVTTYKQIGKQHYFKIKVQNPFGWSTTYIILLKKTIQQHTTICGPVMLGDIIMLGGEATLPKHRILSALQNHLPSQVPAPVWGSVLRVIPKATSLFLCCCVWLSVSGLFSIRLWCNFILKIDIAYVYITIRCDLYLAT